MTGMSESLPMRRKRNEDLGNYQGIVKNSKFINTSQASLPQAGSLKNKAETMVSIIVGHEGMGPLDY